MYIFCRGFYKVLDFSWTSALLSSFLLHFLNLPGSIQVGKLKEVDAAFSKASGHTAIRSMC